MTIFCGFRYVRALLLWIAVYAVLLFASIAVLERNLVGAPPLRALIGLAPMLGAFGILNLVMGQYRSGDELQQKITAESIMFAFGATAILTFSYGLLQSTVGAPQLSYLWVWPVLGGTWLIGTFIARRRYG